MRPFIRVDAEQGRGRFKWLPITVSLFVLSLHVQLTNAQVICGKEAGGAVCPDGSCCSNFGFCGTSRDYCGAGCQSLCTGGTAPLCGSLSAGSNSSETIRLCPDTSQCCSSFGYCGTNDTYCGVGCQNGPCNDRTESGALSTGAFVGIALGVVAVVILILIALLCNTKRRRRKDGQKTKEIARDQEKGVDSLKEYKSPPAPSDRRIATAARGIRFSYDVLCDSTEEFTREIGRGAFGVVYHGKLQDETNIAVKMLLDSERGLKDFEAEVKTLGSINHANLVALFGFCIERQQPFLIYEFVSRGSLDKWIFHKCKVDKNFVLPWKTRVNIMKGTAKGLAYLHEDLQIGQAIIHLDIKPENILLDDLFVPKVADFGMAKLLGSKRTQTLASGGTVGYMAPEIYVGSANAKMDVYSFGIVLLEMLSGRRHLDPSQSMDGIYLPAWAIRKFEVAEELDVIDPLLQEDEFDVDEARRLILVALLCLQRDPDERPGMSGVLRMIEGIVIPQDLPTTLKAELEMTERLVTSEMKESAAIDMNSGPAFIDFSSTSDDLLKDGRSTGAFPRESLRPLLRQASSQASYFDQKRRAPNLHGPIQEDGSSPGYAPKF